MNDKAKEIYERIKYYIQLKTKYDGNDGQLFIEIISIILAEIIEDKNE